MILLGILIVFVVLTVLQRAVYSRFWRRNLSVELDFSARTGIEGSSIALTEIITSRKALPLPWLVVKFQVSRHLFSRTIKMPPLPMIITAKTCFLWACISVSAAPCRLICKNAATSPSKASTWSAVTCC